MWPPPVLKSFVIFQIRGKKGKNISAYTEEYTGFSGSNSQVEIIFNMYSYFKVLGIKNLNCHYTRSELSRSREIGQNEDISLCNRIKSNENFRSASLSLVILEQVENYKGLVKDMYTGQSRKVDTFQQKLCHSPLSQ